MRLRISNKFFKILFKFLIGIIVLLVVLFFGNLLYDYLTTGHRSVKYSSSSLFMQQIYNLKCSSNIFEFNYFVEPENIGHQISEAFTKVTDEQIDNNLEYRSIILAVIMQETGFRTVRKINCFLPVPELFSTSIGMMQINRRNIINNEDILTNSIRLLDKIVLLYAPERIISDDVSVFIFADWVAGTYASKVASVQRILNKRLKRDNPIIEDGDPGYETIKALKESKYWNSKITFYGNLLDRKTFMESPYVKKLITENPEAAIPIIPKTGVKNILSLLTHKYYGNTGWDSCKVFTNKICVKYKSIKKCGKLLNFRKLD